VQQQKIPKQTSGISTTVYNAFAEFIEKKATFSMKTSIFYFTLKGKTTYGR